MTADGKKPRQLARLKTAGIREENAATRAVPLIIRLYQQALQA